LDEHSEQKTKTSQKQKQKAKIQSLLLHSSAENFPKKVSGTRIYFDVDVYAPELLTHCHGQLKKKVIAGLFVV
jgi:hypothetical protein